MPLYPIFPPVGMFPKGMPKGRGKKGRGKPAAAKSKGAAVKGAAGYIVINFQLADEYGDVTVAATVIHHHPPRETMNDVG